MTNDIELDLLKRAYYKLRECDDRGEYADRYQSDELADLIDDIADFLLIEEKDR